MRPFVKSLGLLIKPDHISARIGALTSLRKFFAPKQAAATPRLRLAHFYYAVARSYLKAWLRMHRRSVQHAAILQRKTRCMVRTLNAVALQFAFRKRPAEMRARLRHGKETLAATNQQNGRALVHCACRLILR